MRNAVFQRRAAPSTPLLARQVSRYFHFRFRLRVRRIAGGPDASARIHRLVGFDHVTTGSSWRNDDIRGEGTLAGGVSHGDGRLVKECSIGRHGYYCILGVEVQRWAWHIVVVVTIETTVVVVVVVVVVKLLLLMLMMVMMDVSHVHVT